MAKENMGVCLLVVAALTLGVLSLQVSSYPMPEIMGAPNEQAVRPPLSLLDNKLMKLYMLSYLQSLKNPDMLVKAKRTCLLNAGLSHSCDYKDVLAAIDEGMYLGSENTPGKK